MRSALKTRGAWLVVGAAVAWNLLNLRAETLGVSYLDDSSVHEQMVRFATQQFRSGNLPLTSWFPDLGLGSPQFLHYQSLAATVTGVFGLIVGPDAAFRWSLYILLSLWPASVYLCARLFGIERWGAAASAAMSPFLMSVTGVGYEQHAYVWKGFGVWTQLWASMTLPLAWGLSWRSIRDGRGFCPAVALVSLTTMLHFETGYLALIPLPLWPFVSGDSLIAGVRRASVVLGGSLLAAAWVIVPLIAQRSWAATNEILHETGLVNGYGAGRVLGWLVSGQLLDHARLPVVTLFAAIGLALACARCRKDANARALLVVLAACLLLSFGRATFGALVDVLPGARDIFFRRFMMGIQVAALLLAGGGAAWWARATWNALKRATASRGLGWQRASASNELARAAIALIAAVGVLSPAWLQLASYDHRNTAAIDAQRRADASEGAQLDRLIAVIERDGGGRVYAGMPTNWGMGFTVGAVPVFKYLESRDVDEVGYTLRTASLMTDPEYYFDEHDVGDYILFGIHYVILPRGWLAPVPGRALGCAGPYCLWVLSFGGYVHVGEIVGAMAANRTNVGNRSIALLHSRLPQEHRYLVVAFDRQHISRPSPHASDTTVAGRVITERDDLAQGKVSAEVVMRRPGVVVLSASFDPGWEVTVNHRLEVPAMVAPALVAVRVPAGPDTVTFRYQGYGGYLSLLLLCAACLTVVGLIDLTGHRAREEISAGP
ncbi:MAG: hypothetical protein ACLP0J_02135 [Solirubrobacteraceae bacterium]